MKEKRAHSEGIYKIPKEECTMIRTWTNRPYTFATSHICLLYCANLCFRTFWTCRTFFFLESTLTWERVLFRCCCKRYTIVEMVCTTHTHNLVRYRSSNEQVYRVSRVKRSPSRDFFNNKKKLYFNLVLGLVWPSTKLQYYKVSIQLS